MPGVSPAIASMASSTGRSSGGKAKAWDGGERVQGVASPAPGGFEIKELIQATLAGEEEFTSALTWDEIQGLLE